MAEQRPQPRTLCGIRMCRRLWPTAPKPCAPMCVRPSKNGPKTCNLKVSGPLTDISPSAAPRQGRLTNLVRWDYDSEHSSLYRDFVYLNPRKAVIVISAQRFSSTTT